MAPLLAFRNIKVPKNPESVISPMSNLYHKTAVRTLRVLPAVQWALIKAS
jgi:hypothetical protein